MIKNIVLLVVGLIAGVVFTLTFQNPQRAGRAARDGIGVVESRMTSLRRDACIRDFLNETQCFQVKRASECEAEIVEQCGLPVAK